MPKFILPPLSSVTVFVNSDHDNRLGVWHLRFNKKKKKKKRVLRHSHQQIKTIYKKSSGEGIHTYPLPNPRILYFGLKPIKCLSRDSFGCKVIPSCNCPGGKRALQTIRVCIRTVILKGVGPSSPAPPPATDRYLLLSIIAKLLWIL